MTQLSPTVRAKLISIGRAELAGGTRDDADIKGLRSMDFINRQGPVFWESASADLSEQQLAELTCGLAYLETEFRWLGGSASSVICLFQALVARGTSTQLLDRVSAWILANSRNRYNPFGTQVSLGARNYSEYMSLSSSRSASISSHVEEDKEIEARASAERAVRKKMAAAGAAARNTEVRVSIIESMRDLALAEKLEAIAGDTTYLPQFFPTSIAGAATQPVIDALPRDVRLRLASKLKGRRRGPWGKFRQRLLVSIGPVWNKEPWCV